MLMETPIMRELMLLRQDYADLKQRYDKCMAEKEEESELLNQARKELRVLREALTDTTEKNRVARIKVQGLT